MPESRRAKKWPVPTAIISTAIATFFASYTIQLVPTRQTEARDVAQTQTAETADRSIKSGAQITEFQHDFMSHTRQQEKDADIQIQRDRDQDALLAAQAALLNKVQQSQATIDERTTDIKGQLAEIRGDIKKLLEQRPVAARVPP